MPEKKVTLNDIAQKVGVSRMAVSHVLLGTAKGRISVGKEKAARIRQAAEEMGYVPNRAAQMMHGAKSRLVGVLYDSTHLGFGLTRLNGTLSRIAQSNGYSIVSAITGYEPAQQKNAIESFRSLQVDGVFCMAQDPRVGWKGYGQLLDSFEQVAVLGTVESPTWLTEAYPFAQLSHLAVDHLVETGKRNLALAISDQVYTSSIERTQGFLERVEYHGLETVNVMEARSQKGENGLARAKRILKDLLKAGVDGVVAHNDQLASSLLSAARDLGVSVPGQIGIVGLDNEPFCGTLIPSLSTIDMNWDQVSGRLFGRLISVLLGQDAGDDEEAGPLLIPRGSTVG